MKHVLAKTTLLVTLLLSATRAVASPDIDRMSDIEVSEYAVRMSDAIADIRKNNLCGPDDTSCLRNEFLRHGVSYDDKKAVQKRVVIMIGSIN